MRFAFVIKKLKNERIAISNVSSIREIKSEFLDEGKRKERKRERKERQPLFVFQMKRKLLETIGGEEAAETLACRGPLLLFRSRNLIEAGYANPVTRNRVCIDFTSTSRPRLLHIFLFSLPDT